MGLVGRHSASPKLCTGTPKGSTTTLTERGITGIRKCPFLVLLAFVQISRGLQIEGDENQEHDRCHETVHAMKT